MKRKFARLNDDAVHGLFWFYFALGLLAAVIVVAIATAQPDRTGKKNVTIERGAKKQGVIVGRVARQAEIKASREKRFTAKPIRAEKIRALTKQQRNAMKAAMPERAAVSRPERICYRRGAK